MRIVPLKSVTVLAAIVILSAPSVGHGQQSDTRPGPNTPVQVTNSAANPVPVTIQGNATVTVAAGTTETLISQFITVMDTFDGNHNIGPFSVKNYKSVRIVANRGSCTGCADPVRVRVYTRGTVGGTTVGNQLDTFLIDTADGGVGKSASREYEVPGESLFLSFSNPAPGSTNEVGVLVFGRRD